MGTSLEVAQVFGIANATIGLFSALLMPFLHRGPLRARLLLSVVFLAVAQYQAGAVFGALGGYQAHPHLVRVGSTGFFLIGPCLYLYIRSLANPDRPLERKDALHLLPLLWESGRRLPFFVQPAALKTAIAKATLLQDVLWNRFGFLVVMLGYLVALVPLLRQHERDLRDRHSSLAGRHLLWGFGLMVLWTVGPGVDPLLYIHWARPEPVRWLLGQADFWHMAVLTLTVLMALTLPALDRTAQPEPPSPRPDPSSESGLDLGPSPDARLLQRVQTYMVQDRPWLDPDLSLAGLASRLRMSPDALSRAINGRLGINFFTFVNRYRVAEARRRLTDPEEGGTILQIALSSGFASKSTFNDTFRKFTGLTPREVRSRKSDLSS